MNQFLRYFATGTLLGFSINLSLAHAGLEDQANTVAVTEPTRTTTPCPFLNGLVRNGEIDPIEPTVDQIVTAAEKYGINPGLMRFLAQARAKSGKVKLADLLLADHLPAHLGSLARGDGDRSEVETARLEQLRTNEAYSTRGQISFSQLTAYKHYCWSLSRMGIKDKLISNAEVSLLWRLFGAYRTKNDAGEDVIPLNYVYDLLRWAKMPSGEFRPNTIDPATRSSMVWLILQTAFCKKSGS